MTGPRFRLSFRKCVVLNAWPGVSRGVWIGAPSGDVTQTIGQIPSADQDAKEQLTALIEQLNQAPQQSPPDKAEEAEAVAETAKTLLEQAAAEKPNRTMVRITGKGLKQAAQNLAAVMPTVLTIATQIVDTVQVRRLDDAETFSAT